MCVILPEGISVVSVLKNPPFPPPPPLDGGQIDDCGYVTEINNGGMDESAITPQTLLVFSSPFIQLAMWLSVSGRVATVGSTARSVVVIDIVPR